MVVGADRYSSLCHSSVCCLKDNFKDIKIPIIMLRLYQPGRMYEAFYPGYMVSREYTVKAVCPNAYRFYLAEAYLLHNII